MVAELILGNLPLALLASGLILMALEAISPGAHLIVIGVALAGAGLIGMLFPPAGGALALAGLTLVIGFAATWVYREFDFYGGKGTAQTSDSGSLAGATGYATETITARGGEVKLDSGGFSPYYTARTDGGQIEEGEEIIVLDPGGGNVLTVEAMNAIESDEIDRALAREATAADDGSAAASSTDAVDSAAEPESETDPDRQPESRSEPDAASASENESTAETETEPSG